MFDLDIYAAGLTAAIGAAIGTWLLSILLRDVSIADAVWPLLFALMATIYVLMAPEVGTRSYLVFFLVTLWASRLGSFVLRRNWRMPEDRRYQRMRHANAPGFWMKSLYMVFGMQAVLAWIISLPLLGAMLGSSPIGSLGFAGTVACTLGIALEAIADQQLSSFKSNPANRDQVLTSGLWRYSRHPNYFGEICIWWGFFLIALDVGAWWSILSPLLLTYLIRWMSVAVLETNICERRPGYRHYIRWANALVPTPPRPRSPPG